MNKVKEEGMLKAILFDLDGTLINTHHLIFNSFRQAFDELMKDRVLTDEEIMDCIGPTLHQTGEKYFNENADQFVNCYRKYYQQNHDRMIEAFPGVVEMLQSLKDHGLKLVIVTSKKRDMAIKGLSYLNLLHFFDLIVSSDEVTNPKPHREPIDRVLTYYQLSNEECLMVGDNSHDIECAHAAGVRSVAVGWAMRGAHYLKMYHPTYIINVASELLDIVEKEGI